MQLLLEVLLEERDDVVLVQLVAQRDQALVDRDLVVLDRGAAGEDGGVASAA